MSFCISSFDLPLFFSSLDDTTDAWDEDALDEGTLDEYALNEDALDGDAVDINTLDGFDEA